MSNNEPGESCKYGEQVDLFFDGELNDEQALAFQIHLGDCACCRQELWDALMLFYLYDHLEP